MIYFEKKYTFRSFKDICDIKSVLKCHIFLPPRHQIGPLKVIKSVPEGGNR